MPAVPHEVPLAKSLQAVVLAAGWQLRQELLVSTAPDAMTAPPMKQAAWQVAPLHTSPAPQLVPKGRSLYAVVLAPGWQLRQGFVLSTVPVA
jgi:hypothetical protein